MKKIRLTNTDLEVTLLCLGTANYGTGVSEEIALHQMDLYKENGGNFVDTAHVYGDWVPPETGQSEKTIGGWLKSRGGRPDMILSSKGCHPPIEHMDQPRVNERAIREDVEGSLKNLCTDYIDLYFLHRDDSRVSVAEILEALEKEVQKGNIRYYGCSNWSLGRVREAQDYAHKHGMKGFVSNQMMFTLADVVPETLIKPQLTILEGDFYRYHCEEGMSFMAYMCQAGGYFTKRLRGRSVSPDMEARYAVPSNDTILALLKQYEREGFAVSDFMYQYVVDRPFPSIAIVAFHDDEQLMAGIRGVGCHIPPEIMKQLLLAKTK